MPTGGENGDRVAYLVGLAEPSTTVVLCRLLEEQAVRVHALAERVAALRRHRMPALPPDDWHGPARVAYDELVRGVDREITRVERALEEARVESLRAAATLQGRG